MINNLFFLIYFVVTFFSFEFRTDSGYIRYQITRGDSVREGLLIYKNNKSYFTINPFNPKLLTITGETQVDTSIIDFIVMNYAEKTIESIEYLKNGDRVLFTEKLPEFDWEILPEKKQIGKFTCHKAKMKFRCSEYTAWFSLEIPLAIGPMKTHGLPGAILELNNDTLGENFIATNIEIPSTSLTELKIDRQKKVDIVYDSVEKFTLDYKKEMKKFITFYRSQNNFPEDAQIVVEERECF